MLILKVKTNKRRLFIPVPYTVLNLSVSTLTSKLVTKWAKEYIALPLLDKRALKSIVKELKNHKGLVLVHVKAKDGTEVLVQL
ncbi:MAG: hypothetical protein JWN30_1336 [Bacilli bacterium]|nr:hypothetical protein [Bacilli bacterium]